MAQTATTSNVATTLKTTTFPCTIVGLRWDFVFQASSTAGNGIVSWVIVLVKDGNTANTISQSNGADMLTPEQNVMAFGTIGMLDADTTTGGPKQVHIQGSTKTMRKMQGGDLLQFISLSSLASAGTINGTVQFFCKS